MNSEADIKKITDHLDGLEDLFYSAILALDHSKYWGHFEYPHYRDIAFHLVDGEGWKVNPRFERAATWYAKIKEYCEAFNASTSKWIWLEVDDKALINRNNTIHNKLAKYFKHNFSMRSSSDYNLK